MIRKFIAAAVIAGGLAIATPATPANAETVGKVDACKMAIPVTFHNRSYKPTTRTLKVRVEPVFSFFDHGFTARTYHMPKRSKLTVWIEVSRHTATTVRFRDKRIAFVHPHAVGKC